MDRRCCLCGTLDNMLWYHKYEDNHIVQHYCSACYIIEENDRQLCLYCKNTRPSPFIRYKNEASCLPCYRKRKKKQNECLFIMPTKE